MLFRTNFFIPSFFWDTVPLYVTLTTFQLMSLLSQFPNNRVTTMSIWTSLPHFWALLGSLSVSSFFRVCFVLFIIKTIGQLVKGKVCYSKLQESITYEFHTLVPQIRKHKCRDFQANMCRHVGKEGYNILQTQLLLSQVLTIYVYIQNIYRKVTIKPIIRPIWSKFSFLLLCSYFSVGIHYMNSQLQSTYQAAPCFGL